jgi:streptogramin lyase
VVSHFSADGTTTAANGLAGTGLQDSFGVAIDANGDIWVSNETSVAGANNSELGSVSKFSPSGVDLSGFGFTGGGVYYPQGIAVDSTGDLWIADYGRSSASVLANNGSAISGASGYGTSALPFTSAVAIDGSGNGWFAVQEAAVRVTPNGVVNTFQCCDDPTGIAVDQSGNVWLADYGGASIVELSPSGDVVNRFNSPNGIDAPQEIAIDGGGNVFAANFRGNSITEIASLSATVVSSTDRLGLDATLNEPLGIAIDASGDVWVSNAGGNTVTEFLGLATPSRTPLSGPPVTP